MWEKESSPHRKRNVRFNALVSSPTFRMEMCGDNLVVYMHFLVLGDFGEVV
jgi:hypothetical protein